MVLTRRASLGLALLLSACSPAYLLNDLTPSGGVRRMAEIAYAPGPRHTMDVYRPAVDRLGTPLVVYLYGGNWQSGEKGIYEFLGRKLAQRGAVVAIPDYRLAPQVRFPAFVEDSAAAVAWAIEHAAELGADPNAVFVMGHSAGAYNAAMLALDPRYLAAAGTGRDRLRGVIGLAGPYDFLPITQEDLKPIFAPVQNGPLSQPITFADGRNPPMLLLAGTDDTTVKPRNTESLARRITELGGTVETKLYPGLGHIGIITAFVPLFQNNAPVLDDVWAYITRRMAQRAP